LISLLDQAIDREHILAIVENGYGIAPSTGSPDRDSTLASLTAIGYTNANGVLHKKGVPVSTSIAIENDPNSLSVAHAFADELGTLGIGTMIAAFDPGTFARGLAAHEYTTVLASDDTVPGGYQPLVTLYTKVIPYIADERVHIPTLAASPALRYGDAQKWYTKTDKIWKWLAPKH
jgi:hypothetical protein